jgi:hypothetical protein
VGYLHIPNLYRPEAQQILQFKQVYACEKVHGTSAHISWKRNDALGHLKFFSGGERYERFVELFDQEKLTAIFVEKFGYTEDPVIVYGEAYGGKQQGMSATYGPDLKFVAFDVRVGDCWLNVESAARLVQSLGLEFVAYELIDATLPELDRCRDLASTQAIRNGITEPKIREGIVIRPPFEVTLNNGSRLIAKHKRDEFRETGSVRPTVSAEKAERNMRAAAIAEEWVTAMRLEHVIDQLKASRENKEVDLPDIPALIQLMTADILREGEGEFVVSDEKAFGKAVGSRTVKLFKDYLMRSVHG